jgi:hypothetical protein
MVFVLRKVLSSGRCVAVVFQTFRRCGAPISPSPSPQHVTARLVTSGFNRVGGGILVVL